MGLIKYIKRERERRFRAKVVAEILNFKLPPAIVWDFINGNDKALSESEDYIAFREWKYSEEY